MSKADSLSKTDTSGTTEQQENLGAAGAQLSTAPIEDRSETVIGGPRLGIVGWVRWFWRQLTSMRVALILLFLLSLGAVPGSLIPQTSADELKVADFKKAHETLTPLYEKLQLFDVYSSAWFSAIYILLFVSLIGCIVPRSWQFVGQLRSRPPGAPGVSTAFPRTRPGVRRPGPSRSARPRSPCSRAAASAPTRPTTPWPPRRATSARPGTWPSTSP